MKLLSNWFSKGLLFKIFPRPSKITLNFPFTVFYLAASYVVKLHSWHHQEAWTCMPFSYSAAKGCSDFDPSLNPSRKFRFAPVTTKLEKFS